MNVLTIEAMIFNIRGQRVMLDSDLAELYGVETKVLNQAVKRNLERFPDDFMISPTSSELEDLRSQIVTAKSATNWNHMRRSIPYLFTENGVAMLSSVLTSKRSIQINITIMRTFTKLRSFLAMENSENERLDSLEDQITPKLSKNRRKISLKNKEN